MVFSLFTLSLEQVLLKKNYKIIKQLRDNEYFYYLYALYNNLLSLKYVPTYYKNMQDICYIAVKYGNNYNLKYVPKKLKTEKLCLIGLSKYHYNIKYFPKQFLTENLIIQVIEENNCCGMLPFLLKTEKIYLAYVKFCNCGHSLYDVDDKTYEICLAAVRRNATALQYVPEEFLTTELYLAPQHECIANYIPQHLLHLISDDIWLSWCEVRYKTLKYLPNHLKTQKLYLSYFEKDIMYIKFIPKHFITNNMCLDLANKGLLNYIPKDKRTDELCLISFKNNIKSFKYLPIHLKTYDRCYITVEQQTWLIEYVPPNLIDKKMVNIVVQSNPYFIHCIGEQVLDKMLDEMLDELIIQKYPGFIYLIPTNRVTTKMCYHVVKQCGLDSLPSIFRSEEILLYALETDIKNYPHIPNYLLTKKHWIDFIKNGGHITHVHESFRIEEIYYEFIRKYNGHKISEIPEDKLTEDMCYEGLYLSKFSIWKDIPKKFIKGCIKNLFTYVEKQIIL